MGFRNPFRIQVDENDVAYVSDYSPDAQTPARGRGPGGIGRFEIVRKPSNYGWPTCYKRDLAYYEWNFHEFAPNTTTAGTPLHNPPKLHECNGPTQRNDSLWNIEGGPTVEPGLREVPPVTNPDIWYSYRDNNTAAPLGTPCLGQYAPTAGPIAPGSTTECPRLFPELYTGGVGPHGMTKYDYNPANPNPKKFPAYYDDSVIFGEWTQDTLREMKLDGSNNIAEDQLLPGLRQPRRRAASGRVPVRVRQPDGPAVRVRRRVLPAHVRQRVQRHQPGRRHVQVGVREGPARAEGRADHRQDQRRFAADGQLLQRRIAGRGSGRLDPLRVGLR